MTILVFGSYDFLRKLPDQIHEKATNHLVAITDFHQAVAQIQTASPDVIFVQASLNGSVELCGWLKEQAKLYCIHCILVEDRPQQLTQRSQNDWQWEFDMTAAALHQGADAYIWQLPTEEMATHRLILSQLTVGLRKAQKYRDLLQKNHILSAIALADSLTDLNNRRAFDWELPRQITRARTHNIPMSLIILDVDYFKKVNDKYGHLVGDRLLQLLCTRIRHNLRSQDIAFRYGGEEFVVLLAHTTAEEALKVAQRLNQIIDEQTFSINSKLTIDVTISLGVASLQKDDDEQGMSLLHRADKCLLAAKTSGRNQVISWHQLLQLSIVS
ncbi:MAG TPA: GGDEF domain-containing protein [Leptolyngbyaceae cyanobacterium]